MLTAFRQSTTLLKRQRPPLKAFIYIYRCLSTHPNKFDMTMSALAADLGQKQPKFSVAASSVHLLFQPSDFYSLLLDMIKTAERRIFISSLYIGSSETELVNILMDTLRNKDNLQLYFQLDLHRSTRPGSSSSAKILLPLLRAFPDRVHVSLFRSPYLRGVMANLVPPRFNEGWGTWHAKIYGADDDVIISGANLNKAYFTNRQDRYIFLKNQPRLSNYCFDFLRTVSTFSYQLLPNDSTNPPKNLNPNSHSYTQEDYTLLWPDPSTHPYHINNKAHKAFSTLQSSHRTSPSSSSSQEDETTDGVTLFPIIQAGQFDIHEEEQFFQLLFGHLKKGSTKVPLVLPSYLRNTATFSSIPSSGSDLSSSPGSGSSANITQDNSLTQANSRERKGEGEVERPLIDLTSGYFGLYEPYQILLLANPQVDVRIVAASPMANGFFGSKGISGRIPEGYTYLEKRFMKAVRRVARLWGKLGVGFGRHNGDGNGGEKESNVELGEWGKDGWTYHAKGLWLSRTTKSSPVLTLFGSTNLNSRSAHIDTELSFVMILPSPEPSPPSPPATSTPTPTSAPMSPSDSKVDSASEQGEQDTLRAVDELRTQLACEVQRIRADVTPWKGDMRKVRFGTKILVRLLGGML